MYQRPEAAIVLTVKNAIVLLLVFCAVDATPALAFQHNIAVIAHRGSSASAPENTLAAFMKAMTDGADMIELDVHQSRDSQLVVIHDETVDRTTNGKGKIKDFSYEELRKFDAGSWFRPGNFQGEHIPRLIDVAAILDSTTKILLEIKEGSRVYPDIERHVVECLLTSRLEHRVIIKSFEDDVLAAVRRLRPSLPLLKVYVCQLPIVRIVVGRGFRFGSVLKDSVEYLQPHWLGLTNQFVDAAHDKGFKVFVWNVNTEARMEKMIGIGVDGIETDDPLLLRKLIPKTE